MIDLSAVFTDRKWKIVHRPASGSLVPLSGGKAAPGFYLGAPRQTAAIRRPQEGQIINGKPGVQHPKSGQLFLKKNLITQITFSCIRPKRGLQMRPYLSTDRESSEKGEIYHRKRTSRRRKKKASICRTKRENSEVIHRGQIYMRGHSRPKENIISRQQQRSIIKIKGGESSKESLFSMRGGKGGNPFAGRGSDGYLLGRWFRVVRSKGKESFPELQGGGGPRSVVFEIKPAPSERKKERGNFHLGGRCLDKGDFSS